MSVVCITCSACVTFCLPSLFAFVVLGIRGQAIRHLHYKLHPMLQWEVCFCKGMCLYACALNLCVCVCTVLFRLLRTWINWAWVMMMMIMMTAMFIACLVKKITACVQSMKCDNLFVDSCPLPGLLSLRDRIPSFFSSTSVGPPPSLPNALLCVVDRCTFYRLLNAYVYQRLCPFFFPILCERDSVISVCQTWHVSAFPLHLFDDPDIAMEHTHTRIVLLVILFPLMELESCSTTKPLCMWSSVQARTVLPVRRQLEFGVLSLEQGGDEDAIHFLLPLALLIGTLMGLSKPHVCVRQCHRREGGSGGLMYQPVIKLSQM